MSLNLWMPGNRFFNDEWTIFDPRMETLTTKSGDQNRALAPLMSADLIETPTDFHVHADLPGVDPADLHVTIEDKRLKIEAERKHVHETTTDKVHSMERSYGKVMRQIRIPQNVDLEKVTTTFKNGALNVIFPKIEPPAPKSIKLEVKTD
jgi:HSP20 family protein